MLAKDIVSQDIPSVKTTDTGSLVIDLMDEYKVSHLPLLKQGEYVGLISDTDILDLKDAEDELGNQNLALTRPFVIPEQHIYDVIKLFSTMHLTVLPVLDEKERYIGTISIYSLLDEFSTISATNEPGGIIVLEMNQHDYSLTQIAQIVEGSDAKVLSCYLSTITDTTMIYVTLKINKEDLSGILQTFDRYEYKVKASFHQSTFSDDLKKRFDSFMKFINV